MMELRLAMMNAEVELHRLAVRKLELTAPRSSRHISRHTLRHIVPREICGNNANNAIHDSIGDDSSAGDNDHSSEHDEISHTDTADRSTQVPSHGASHVLAHHDNIADTDGPVPTEPMTSTPAPTPTLTPTPTVAETAVTPTLALPEPLAPAPTAAVPATPLDSAIAWITKYPPGALELATVYYARYKSDIGRSAVSSKHFNNATRDLGHKQKNDGGCRRWIS
jgi:hypothetical protein